MVDFKSKSHMFLFLVLFLLGGVATNNVIVQASKDNPLETSIMTVNSVPTMPIDEPETAVGDTLQ